MRLGKRPVRPLWRRWVVSRGVDDTDASARRRTLVVAPHPDDETIGCGAAIARKRAAGTDVRVVVVCDGRHSHHSELIPPRRLAEIRARESVEACAVLGVAEDQVSVLGFEELTLWRCLDDVAAALEKVIGEFDPDEILVVTDQDWHTDHQATHVALCRAVARRGFRGVLGAYPVWFWADGPWRTVPILPLRETWRELVTDPLAARRLPRPWVVRTATFAARKREAFERYRSQTTNLTGEPGWATFPAGWIEPFCAPAEVFFPIAAEAVSASVGRGEPVRRRRRTGTEPAAGSPGWQPERDGAMVADTFSGAGPLDGAAPVVGSGGWRVVAGELAVEAGGGVAGLGDGGAAELEADGPAGRVRLEVVTSPLFAGGGRAGLSWRGTGGGAAVRVTVDADDAVLWSRDDGEASWAELARVRSGVESARRHVLEVIDEGHRFAVHLDGRPLFDRWFDGADRPAGHRVGFETGPALRSRVTGFAVDARPAPSGPARSDG